MDQANGLMVDNSDDYSFDYTEFSLNEREQAALAVLNQAAPAIPDQAGDLMAESLQAGIDSRGGDFDPTKAVREEQFGPGSAGVVGAARSIAEIPRSVGYGAIAGVNEAIQTAYDAAVWLNKITPSFGMRPSEEMENGLIVPQLPNLSAPDRALGGVVSNIAQFLTGFAAGGQTLKGWKAAGTAGQFLKAAAQGAISDFGFFDPQEARLSNLVQEVPALANPVNEFLAAEEDDGNLEGRLKNAVEGLGLGAATEGVTRALGAGIRAFKNMRAARAASEASPEAAEAVFRGMNEAAADINKAKPLSDLGDIDGPVVAEVRTPAPEALPAPDGAAGPPAVSGAAEPAEDDFFINFARIDAPDDVKDAMQFMANRYRDELNAARRGEKMTFKQMELNADQEDAWNILGTMRKKREQQGFATPLNAEQSLAARKLWVSAGDKLTEAAKRVAASDSTENKFAFMKMINVYRTIQNEVIAARTETARALASWRIPSGPDALMFRQMEETLDQVSKGALGKGRKTIKELAESVATLSAKGQIKEMDQLVQKSLYAMGRDMVVEYRTAALLTNWTTHLVNAGSNFAVAAQQVIERGIAGRTAQIAENTGGVMPGEAMALLSGYIGGAKDGLRLAWKTARTGEGGNWGGGLAKIEQPRVAAISSEALRLAKDSPLGRMVDAAGVAIRTPFRLLQGSDEFFKEAAYRAEMQARAHRQASMEMATGKIDKDQFGRRVNEILENPSDDMKMSSVDYALYTTFTDRPGDSTQGIMRILRGSPALRLFVPFIQTPSRLLSYAVERSPAAPIIDSWRADLAAGGSRAQLAKTRMAVGTTMITVGADLAFGGHITGGGPKNPAERQTLMRTGWQPYSLKIGDRYFSFSRTDPIGMTLSIAADCVELINHIDQDDQEVNIADAVGSFALSIASSAMSRTYMQGMAEMIELLNDPERRLDSWLNRFAGSFVPAGAANLARQIDPYMLEVNDMVDAMKARVPGLSASLPPKLDLWGRPISYRSGLGAFYDAASPIASRRENPEPIDQEMLRLGLSVATPKRTVNFDGIDVDLTRPEFGDAYTRYVQLAGNEAKPWGFGKGCMDTLNDMVSGKGAQAVDYRLRSDGPKGGKAEKIEGVIAEFQKYSKQQILKEYPALRDYVRAKKAGEIGRYNL